MTDFLPRLTQALEARGTTANAAAKAAGYPGIVANWKSKGQVPSVGHLGAVCDALRVDPAWVAYGKEPTPIAPPNGFHAQSQALENPDDMLGAAYAAWKADDGQLEARFFDALEMMGLLDALYLIRCEDGELVYDHIGSALRKTLGWAWWIEAPGKRVVDDPDPAFSAWTLGAYQRAIQKGEPSREDCLVVSRYTAIAKGWKYSRLILPVDYGLVVLTQVIS